MSSMNFPQPTSEQPESSSPGRADVSELTDDDLLLRVIRIVREATGETLSANHPPAALAVTHVREEAPFLRLPSRTLQAAQIHHIATPQHWLVSGLVDGDVCVWDTVRVGQPASLKRELAGLYGDVAGDADGALPVGHYYPLIQRGGTVCGWMASAFLVDYALGLVPHRRRYSQESAKSAVQEVLRSGTLKPCSTPIPTVMAARIRPAVEYFVAPWCCGETGGGELLADCDDCGRWYHVRDKCLRPFMGPAERAVFIRSRRRLLDGSANDAGPPLVCCDRSPASPSVHRNIAEEF